MQESADDTPRETPAAKGSDSRISVAPKGGTESSNPSSNPPWMDEPTKRERRAQQQAITRAEGRAAAARDRVHSGVAAVVVLAVTSLVIATMLMVFVFAVGVGIAFAVGVVAAAVVFVAGRVTIQWLRDRT